jgi:hypothetical protein
LAVSVAFWITGWEQGRTSHNGTNPDICLAAEPVGVQHTNGRNFSPDRFEIET